VVMDLKAIGARGRVELNPLDVNQFVRESLQTHDIQSILRKNPAITFSTTLAEGLPVLAGNATDLHRVLLNLILNAVEATSGASALELETTIASLSHERHGYETIAPGEYVVICIRDMGAGIPPTLFHRMFEPFVSGDREAGRRSGSGLGLAVVHAVMQDHKGYIDVESGGKWSTTFSLFFPIAAAQAVPAPPPQKETGVRGGAETILVVDDDPTQRFVARRVLEGLGYTVTEAPHGHAALEMLSRKTPDSSRHDFDLILLDMIMEPDFSGLDTLRVIRKTHPNQKVVMASGQADDVSARATEELGADWLAKPYRRAGLGRAVRERLDGGGSGG
jgi:CheY-like chemotaxis protein